MKNLFLLIIATSISAMTTAQNLPQQFDQVKHQLKQIQTVKYTVNQSMTLQKGSIVDFVITTTDLKGNGSTVTYRMDLADIDPSLLKSGIERNMMKVEVHTNDKNKYITEIKDRQIKRYLSRIKFDVKDMDHANQLINALKSIIVSAKQIEDRGYDYSTLDEILMELSMAIGTFGSIKEQGIVSNPSKKSKLSYSLAKADGVNKKSEFNLSDMNPNTVKVNVQGTGMNVSIDAYGGQKAVKTFENGLAKGFESRVIILPKSISNAKRIKRLVEMAISAAKGRPASSSSSGSSSVNSTVPPSTSSSSTAASTSGSNRVQLTKSPKSGIYSWAGVFEFPGYSAQRLHEAVLASIPPKCIIANSPSQIAYQLMGGNGTALRLGGDAFISFTVKIGFKEGKIRIEVTDFYYDNRAWGFSAPQKLDTMDGKKLNKVAADINRKVDEGITNFRNTINEKLRLTSEEDW